MTGQPFCSPDCRRRAGWLEAEDGTIVGRCACRTASPSPKDAAMRKAAEAHPNALEAAVRIIEDFALSMPVFSSNDTRKAMDAADVRGPVIGIAFGICRKNRWIDFDGTTYVPSTDPGTHGHPVKVWTSLKYKVGVA